MPEFFIAIIGGVWLLYKFFSRESFARKMNRQRDEYIEINKAYIEKMACTEKMREEVRIYLRNPKNKKAIFEELDDNLTAIYGEDFDRYTIGFDQSKIFPWVGTEYQTVNYWFEALMLSKKGYLTPADASCGIGTGIGRDAVLNAKYIQQIERNIQKIHPSFAMYMAPDRNDPNNWQPYCRVFEPEHRFIGTEAQKKKAKLSDMVFE